MGVNKVIVNGQTKIDLTADTVTSDKVASGKTFHLANGNSATGSMPDYTSFPLYCQTLTTQIITCSGDSKILTLPATNLNGRPISFLIVALYATDTVNSVTTTGTGTYYLTLAEYTKDYCFINSSGEPRQHYYQAVRPIYSSYRARVSISVSPAVGRFYIQNESQLASGGTYIELSEAYFRSGATYQVLIGG